MDNISKWNEEGFRGHVEHALEMLKKGKLFINYGISETDIILRDGEVLPPKHHKGHNYLRLLESVVVALSKEMGGDWAKRKTILKQLRKFDDTWAKMIHEMQDKDKKPLPPVDPHAVEWPRLDPDRKLSEKALAQKVVFEKERDEILSEIPESIKARFGQVYFSKWSGNTIPVLVLNPFHVPPGPVRDTWYTMFEKVKANNRLKNMTHLCYWYGGYKDPGTAYSLIASKNLIPYEVGAKKGNADVPAALRKKMDEGKKLTSAQDQLVRGLDEMKLDLRLLPELRRGKMMTYFLEVYELSTDSESEDDALKTSKSISKKKTTKGKKVRRKSLSKKDEEDTIEFEPTKKRAKEEIEGDNVIEKDDAGKEIVLKKKRKTEGSEFAEGDAADEGKPKKKGRRKTLSKKREKKKKTIVSGDPENDDVVETSTSKVKNEESDNKNKNNTDSSMGVEVEAPPATNDTSVKQDSDIPVKMEVSDEGGSTAKKVVHDSTKNDLEKHAFQEPPAAGDNDDDDDDDFNPGKSKLLTKLKKKKREDKKAPTKDVKTKLPPPPPQPPARTSADSITSDDDEFYDSDDAEDEYVEPPTDDDDYDDDDDFDPVLSKPAGKTKTKKSRVQKKAPAKKDVASKFTVKQKKSSTKVKKPQSLIKLRALEQQRFEECEKQFLPLVNRWKKALDTKDTSALEGIYTKVLQVVEQFTSPFIEAYDISPLMKQSKQVHDTPARKELFEALRQSYIEKKKDIPKGFKAKKTRMSYVDSEKSDKKQGKGKVVEGKVNVKTESTTKNDSPSNTQQVDNGGSGSGSTSDAVTAAAATTTTAASSTTSSSGLGKIPTKNNSGITPKQGSESTVTPATSTTTTTTTKRETPSKLERKKKFSLGSLMRPTPNNNGNTTTTAKSSSMKTTQQHSDKNNVNNSSSSTSQSSSRQQKMPSWISEPSNGTTTTTSSSPSSPTDIPLSDSNRLFALEFLQQATPFIPHNKYVNHDVIARELECAAYEWSTSRTQRGGTTSISTTSKTWKDYYWEKIHNLVASISGNCGNGHGEINHNNNNRNRRHGNGNNDGNNNNNNNNNTIGTIATMIAAGKFKSPKDVVSLSFDNIIASFEGKQLSI